MLIRSQLPLLRWPAVPNDAGAQALALQFQFERNQWLPAAALEQAQFGQLACLLEEARRHIPYWRETLDRADCPGAAPLDRARLQSLPVLLRRDVQALGDQLLNRSLDRAHGPVVPGNTSGSTGEPVRFYRTGITQHFWRACTLREHLWQCRDFAGKLAAIRSNVERGSAPHWGEATENVVHTGPSVGLNIRTDLEAQLDWLVAENPDYLLTHPSNLRALAARALERGAALPRLKQLRTFGEQLTADTVALCRRAWGVGIADTYSSEETGYLALQCEHGAYHVQSESVLLEVVDDAGRACAPGECGRVLVTTLQNFAMPLIRYEIGDYAVAGAPCACGRSLPVLARILGRRRNMLRLPDGSQHWPSFPEDRWAGIAPIAQLQVVQTAPDRIVIRVHARRPLSAHESATLIATFSDTLNFPHRIDVEQVAAFRRGVKFEDFVSELP
jgi:phenylacetate-CoA ligase